MRHDRRDEEDVEGGSGPGRDRVARNDRVRAVEARRREIDDALAAVPGCVVAGVGEAAEGSIRAGGRPDLHGVDGGGIARGGEDGRMVGAQRERSGVVADHRRPDEFGGEDLRIAGILGRLIEGGGIDVAVDGALQERVDVAARDLDDGACLERAVEVAVRDEKAVAGYREAGGKKEARRLRAIRPEGRRQQLRRERVAAEQQRRGDDRALLHASGLPRAARLPGQAVFSTCSREKSASGANSSCRERSNASRLSRWAVSLSITITSSKKRSTTGRSSASAAYAAR